MQAGHLCVCTLLLNITMLLPLPLPYYFTIFFQGRGARVLLRRDDAITNLGTRILKPRMRPDRGRAELEDLAAESGFRWLWNINWNQVLLNKTVPDSVLTDANEFNYGNIYLSNMLYNFEKCKIC